jgi:hypothetical protein
MLVKRLYVVNDGAGDLDMMLLPHLLPPDYEVVGVLCGRWFLRDVRKAYYSNCVIEEVEIAVDNATLDDVITDLHYIDSTEKVDMFDMIFVAEVEDGYVELSINDIRKYMWEEFEEELKEGI